MHQEIATLEQLALLACEPGIAHKVCKQKVAKVGKELTRLIIRCGNADGDTFPFLKLMSTFAHLGDRNMETSIARSDATVHYAALHTYATSRVVILDEELRDYALNACSEILFACRRFLEPQDEDVPELMSEPNVVRLSPEIRRLRLGVVAGTAITSSD